MLLLIRNINLLETFMSLLKTKLELLEKIMQNQLGFQTMTMKNAFIQGD